MQSWHTLLLVIATFMAGSIRADTPTWPQYRGPGGDGWTTSSNLPTRVDHSTRRWKTKVEGKAWSSPVVSEGQIWLTNATEDGKRLSVLCLDQDTGDIRLDRVVQKSDDPAFCHPVNSYASCTPVVVGDHVVCHFGSALTVCLNGKTFEERWRREDLPCDHFRGPASSPIVYRDRVLVAVDGVDVQYVVALDLETGETIWKTDRDLSYANDSPDWHKAYGTASVIDFGTGDVLVFLSAWATVIYELDTGKALVTIETGGMNVSSPPILREGRLILLNGQAEMMAVDADDLSQALLKAKSNRQNDLPLELSKDSVLWRSRKAVAKKSSPLIHHGWIFMNSDDGILSCRNLGDGKIHWRERMGRAYAASPIGNDSHVWFFSEDGDVIVIRCEDQFELVSESRLEDGVMASPAVVKENIIIRTRTSVECFAR